MTAMRPAFTVLVSALALALRQLALADARVHLGRPYGMLPDLSQARKDADIVFTQNGTTAGARIRQRCQPEHRAGYQHGRHTKQKSDAQQNSQALTG